MKKSNKKYMLRKLLSIGLAIFLVLQTLSVVFADTSLSDLAEEVTDPQTVESPAAEESPGTEESPGVEESPAAEESPGTEESPGVEESPQLQEAAPQAAVAAQGAPIVQGGITPQAGGTVNLSFDYWLEQADVTEDSGKFYAETGASFRVGLSYTVAPESDDGVYKDGEITIKLPDYVEFVHGTITPDMSGVSYDPITRLVTFKFNENAQLEPGSTKTVYASLKFKNLTTSDNVLFDIAPQMNGAYSIAGSEDRTSFTFPADWPNSPLKVYSKVTDEWDVKKSVVGGEVPVPNTPEDGYYTVTYKLDANLVVQGTDPKEAKSANSTGRLELYKDAQGKYAYSLKDTFNPSEYKAGGEPIFVSLTDATGNATPIDPSYYTLTEVTANAGTAQEYKYLTAVEITHPVLTTSDASLVPTGTTTSGSYLLTVKYAVAPYNLASNIPDGQVLANKHIINNEATLDVKYVDGTDPAPVDADALVRLGEKETSTGSVSIIVKKYIKIGTEEIPLDDTIAGYYDTASFSLYSDPGYSVPAVDKNGNDFVPLPLDIETINGQVRFSNLYPGTYYLRETVFPKGVPTAGRVTDYVVKVAADGSLTYGTSTGTEIDPADNIVKIVNNVSELGSLKFTKYAKREGAVNYTALAGATFRLSDGTNTYNATSGDDGVVRFYAVVPGTNYTLTETGYVTADGQRDTAKEKEFGWTGEVQIATGLTVTANATVTPTLQKSANAVYNDAVLSKVRVNKLDDESAALLGATFKMYGPYTAEPDLDTFTPDSTAVDFPMIDVSSKYAEALELGSWYVFEETSAPSGYSLRDTYYKIQVKEGDADVVNVLNVYNDKEIRVYFEKWMTPSGASTGENLYPIGVPGISFEVYTKDSGGNYHQVLSKVYNSSGGAVADGDNALITRIEGGNVANTANYILLAPGTYYYKEKNVSAPSSIPVEMKTGYIEFTVADQANTVPNASQTVSVWNRSAGEGRIIFKKLSSVSQGALTGATFLIYNVDPVANPGATPVDTVTADASGNYISKYLPAGNYWYVESVVPTNYFKTSTSTGTETIVSYTDSLVTVYNDPPVNVQFIKKDSKTGGGVQGINFRLYTDAACTQEAAGNKLYTTGAGGQLNFKDLVPGQTYYFKEIAPTATNAPYVTNTVIYSFTAPTVADLLNTGNAYDTRITLVSSNSDNGTRNITNVRKAQVLVKKTGNWTEGGSTTSKNLTGGEFALYNGVPLANDSNRIGGVVAAANGVITFDTLVAPGTDYYVKEITAPEGYSIPSPGYWKLDEVQAGDNISTSYRTGIYHATIDNTPSMGKFKILKRSSVSPYPAVAATFSYVKVDGTGTPQDPYVEVGTEAAGTKGTISTTVAEGGVKTSVYLPPGTYKLVETVVNETDYVLDPTPRYIVVTAGELNQVYFDSPIENDPRGKIKFTKLESFAWTSESEGTPTPSFEVPMDGATFEIVKYSTGDFATDRAAAGGLIDTVTTVNGVYTTPDSAKLVPGDYWINEISTKTGYVIPASNPWVVTVEAGKTSVVKGTSDELVIRNTSNDGQIVLFKYELGTGNPLDRAQFKIYVPATQGETGAEQIGTTGVWVKPYTNNLIADMESGRHDGFTGTGRDWSGLLPPGTYYLKETKAPTDYYIVDTWTGPIEVKAGEASYVEVPNAKELVDPIAWKFAENGSTPLPGAYFGLFTTAAEAQAMSDYIQGLLNAATNYDEYAAVFEALKIKLDNASDPIHSTYKIQQVAKSLANGSFQFENLIPGVEYYIVELAPPQYDYNITEKRYYTWDGAVHAAKPDPASGEFTGGLNIRNYKGGTFLLKKVVVINGEEFPIDGVEFFVYKAGTDFANWELDAQHGTWTNLTNPVTSGKSGSSTGKNGDGTAGNYRSITLPAGNYYIVESTTVPAGIKTPDADVTTRRYKVTIVDNGENETYYGLPYGSGTNIKNDPLYGAFLLAKYDGTDTTDPRATYAATFEVYIKDGADYVAYPDSTKDPFTFTTKAGEPYYYSDLLPEGEYKLVEKTPPAGMTGRSTPIYLEIKAGCLTIGDGAGGYKILNSGEAFDSDTDEPIEVENYPYGSIELIKYGVWQTEETALNGVTFALYTQDPDVEISPGVYPTAYRTDVTANGGKLKFSDLPAWDGDPAHATTGVKYWLREMSLGANANYEMGTTTTWQLTVYPGQTATPNDAAGKITNPSKGGKVKIQKIDGDDGTTPLVGVQFELYNSNAAGDLIGGAVTTLTTLADGTVTSGLLSPGWYILKEVRLGTGNTAYRLPTGEDALTTPFEITKNSFIQFTAGQLGAIENFKQRSILVEKYDAQAGTIITTDYATFALYDKDPAVEISPGVYPTPLETENTVNGTLTFTNLKAGTDYWIKETKAPSGYTADPVARKVTTAAVGTTVDADLVVTHQAQNNQQGELWVKKLVKWGVGTGATDEPLAGAKFVIGRDLDGNGVLDPSEYIVTPQTDASGVAVTDINGEIKFTGLDAHTDYIVKEIYSPVMKPTSTLPAPWTGLVVVPGAANANKVLYEGTSPGPVKNIAETGNFTLDYYKYGTTGDANRLPDGVFELEVSYDGGLTWETAVKLEDPDEQVDPITPTTDKTYASGYFPAGDYRIVHITAPNGYRIMTVYTEFEIIAGQTTPVVVYSDALGNIVISKKSDTANGNVALTDGKAVFKLYKEGQDHKTATATATSTWDNAAGQYKFIGVEPGRYFIVETKAADNHVLTDPVNGDVVPGIVEVADLQANMVEYPVTVYNNANMGAIHIIKEEETTGTGLKGAVFEIYAADQYGQPTGPVLDTVTSGNDGTITSKLLPAGQNYVIKEIKAPDNYIYDNAVTPWLKLVTNLQPILDPTAASNTNNYNIYTYVNVPTSKGHDGHPTSIAKSVDKTTTDNSLLVSEHKAVFSVKGYAGGGNKVPYDSFSVTDDSIGYWFENSSGTNEQLPDTEALHTINELRVYKATNAAGSPVSATIYYQTREDWLQGSTTWRTAANGTLTGLNGLTADGDYKTYSFAANGHTDVYAVRVVYTGAGVDFRSVNGFDMVVTFENRGGADFANANRHEVVQLSNFAKLNYQYTIRTSNNKDQVVKTDTPIYSNTVYITVPAQYKNLIPIDLGITATTSSSVTAGGTVDFVATYTNKSTTEDVKNPVLVIDTPFFTDLDTTYMTGGPDGEKIGFALTNGSNLTFDLSKVEFYDMIDPVTGESFTRIVIKFDEDDQYLEPGASFSISFRVVTDSSVTTSGSPMNVRTDAWGSSLDSVPPTYENPTGTSITNYDAGVLKGENDSVDDKVGGNREYLNAFANINISENSELSITKQVRGDSGTQYGISGVTVYPNGEFSYRIVVRNGSPSANDIIQKLRIVDALPVYNDAFVLDNTSGGLTDRKTTMPAMPVVTSVSYDSPGTGGSVSTYYSTQQWDAASRAGNRMTGMLTPAWGSNDWSSAGWSSGTPSDWSTATAVGFEINLGSDKYLTKNDTYVITINMQAPGFTQQEAQQYLDSIMYNSVAMSAVPANGANKNLESRKVAVKLKMVEGEIGDFVWIDENQNGIQDDGPASGVAGSNVTLVRYAYDEHTVTKTEKTIQTGPDGSYLFTGLPCNALKAGKQEGSINPLDYIGDKYYEYEVYFEGPGGTYTATTLFQRDYGGNEENDSNIYKSGLDGNKKFKTDPLTLSVQFLPGTVVQGEKNHTIDAGFVLASALGNRVWLDTNKNGFQDANEPTEIGINNVIVNLYKYDSQGVLSDKPVQTTRTARMVDPETGNEDDGIYLFTDLTAGNYVIEFDVSRLVSTKEKKPVFGFTKPGTGKVAERYIDSDAKYPVDGNDLIRRTDDILLAADDSDYSWDAGLVLYSRISGEIFDDQAYVDYNALQIPLPGSTATLYRVLETTMTNSLADQPNSNVSAASISSQAVVVTKREYVAGPVEVDSKGRYSFEYLDDGTYQVYFEYPEGYYGVQANTTGDDDLDSHMQLGDKLGNIGYKSGYSEVLDIQAGKVPDFDNLFTVYDNINGGARIEGSIGDYVWEDLNNDGIQDAGEPGVEGVRVVLLQRRWDSATNSWGEWTRRTEGDTETVTDANGYYKFTGLFSGPDSGYQYRVIFCLNPATQVPTIANAGSDTAVDSDALPGLIYGDGYTGYGTTADGIQLGYGDQDMTWDCGIASFSNRIGDYVWFDTNLNGLQDAGEPGVEGITVVLERSSNDAVDESTTWTEVERTATNSAGWYQFINLDRGYYRVKFKIDRYMDNAGLLPSSDGYMPTIPNNGDAALDSDASVELGDGWYVSMGFYVERLTNGIYEDLTWDAGIRPYDPNINWRTGDPNYTYSYLRTGDNTNVWLWLVIVIGAAAAIVVTRLAMKKRGGSRS